MMFDVTNKASYRHLEYWHDVIRSFCNVAGRPPVSIVVCGNKSDLEGRVVYPRHTVFPKKYGYPYFDVSSMSNFNFDAVFLAVIRQLLQ
jgi:GTPase SAR1 family protein